MAWDLDDQLHIAKSIPFLSIVILTVPVILLLMNYQLFNSLPYIPGSTLDNREPLSQFLPPIQNGVISTWLQNNIPQGSWILDPFCASPRLAVEAARAGYRLLVTANNPIARFLLDMAAEPPSQNAMKAALAELASSYKADERIELHIRALYNTRCARCGQIVSADAFLWEHGNPSPYARIYSCPTCGDSGEHPCTPFDAERISQLPNVGLHKARALERVVASNDQDRIHVEQALTVYVPRALYALITIINKIEGLNISTLEQKYLAALLLYAFDQSNSMMKPSGQHERRRQLTIPRHFRENNIWLTLEKGIDIWSRDISVGINPKVPVSTWPEEPPSTGGICIFDGRLISLASSLAGVNIKAVCAAIPRPNQAFWTLSALWAGWLWGRDAVGTFKSVLHRQRYDWGWHTTALSSIFSQLVNFLDPSTNILGLLGEAEPGFLAAVLVAARFTGCGLQGISLRPEEDQAQILWMCKNNPNATQTDISLIEMGVQAAHSYLETRGEPTSYFNTITSAFVNIIQQWKPGFEHTEGDNNSNSEDRVKITDPTEKIEPSPTLAYSTVYNSAREALSYRSGFLRFNLQDLSGVETTSRNQSVQDSLFSLDIGKTSINDSESENSEQSIAEIESGSEKERPTRSSDISESEFVWLRAIDRISQISITDNCETTLIKYLTSHPGCTIGEIDKVLCEGFPGLYTPDPEFIQIFLESYGEKDISDSIYWHLRAEDLPEEREKDIRDTYSYIHLIAQHLDLDCVDHTANQGKTVVSWIDNRGEYDYRFFPIVSASLGEIVFFTEQSSSRNFIVIPASRANMVIYKIRRDPRLYKAFNPSQGTWRFLKFRHLRSLAENPLLNRENLDQLISLDPITYTTSQLRLI
jgi:hypothetical protein